MTTAQHLMLSDWLHQLSLSSAKNNNDHPNHYVSDPAKLVTTCTPTIFSLGTGASILSSALTAASNAVSEVLLVTCFWAHSPSQDLVAQLLRELSVRAVENGQTIRVRICFSSLSITQKLFHPATIEGKGWPSSTWESIFGLPSLEELPGLDLRIKSVFIRPFSVMHPKFLVIDRKLAWMPSCNVSWEKWFEGCIEFKGDLVQSLCQFFHEVWEPLPVLDPQHSLHADNSKQKVSNISEDRENQFLFSTQLDVGQISAVLLPSPHHRNPRFRPWPLSSQPPPTTPLDLFLLTLIRHAKKKIYIQTPNLTASPVVTALLSALDAGVDVHIVTSERLMILEQLGTAGTVTELCVRNMICRYQKLKERRQRRITDEEEGLDRASEIGTLKVNWYHARGESRENEPVKSHFKCCIMDGEITVLGSGNLDRASWYTSQELGVAFFSREFAEVVMNGVRGSLVGRLI